MHFELSTRLPPGKMPGATAAQRAAASKTVLDAGPHSGLSLDFEKAVTFSAQEGYQFLEQRHNIVVTDLANAYRERRVTITECIYKRPSHPIQDFADAFLLRKDK